VDWNRKEKYNGVCDHASRYYWGNGMMQNNAAEMEDTRLAVPDGGIASFVPDDDEMDDDVEDYGSEGIAQFPALAQRMAAMGRNGDDSIAHVQTGELVIPAALLEQDPALKEGLFQRLRDMGIEDPERYVVGSEGNSLNPDTGLPEFFFKKIFKTIKKWTKGVIKVLKKIAPIVLPIALNFVFPGMGAIAAGALGSGIGTLVQGGSFKDALKSALIGGITGGVVSGVGGAISGEGFMAGVKQGFTGTPGMGFFEVNPSVKSFFGGADVSPTVSTSGNPPVEATNPIAPKPVTTDQVAAADVASFNAPAKAPGFGESIKAAFTPNDGISFGEGMKNAFFPSSTMVVDGKTLTNPTVTQVLQANGITNPLTATAAQQTAAQSLISQAAPSMLRTYAPIAAAGLATAGATGMFDPVPGEPPNVVQRDEQGNVVTGADLIAQNPGQYLVGDLGGRVLNPETGQYEDRASSSVGAIGDLNPMYQMPTSYSVPTSFPTNVQSPYLMASNPGGPFARPYVTMVTAPEAIRGAAQGGAIFPRRNGGIMPDEGVPGQDSVRAMLMPGEFVMTTNAVRGAGNGNVRQGINNMYSMMRNLETRGKAMA
jgi:hypothetical protein